MEPRGSLGYVNKKNQVMLSICHGPGSWPHRFICHKPGMGTLLSIHFTDKETEA